MEGRLSLLVVEGLAYEVGSEQQRTDLNGAFRYEEAQSLVFSIGDIQLPSFTVKPNITPFDIGGPSDTDNRIAVNVTRLLLAIDEDGNPNNGIRVGDTAHAMGAEMSVDFASDNFDSDVANFVSNSGSSLAVLPSTSEALRYLVQQMGYTDNCAEHPKSGEMAEFQTRSHGVSGTVTVIDSCLLLVTHFSYDGGGLPDVYFYTGPEGDFSAGRLFGDNLYGRVFEDEHFLQRIPLTALNELDGVSIWCVGVGVSFGDGLF